MKTCRTCEIQKYDSEFTKSCLDCKPCRNLMQKEYRKNNPEIIKKIREKRRPLNKQYYANPENEKRFKNSQLLRDFKITLDDYNQMLENQKGVCAICGEIETSVRNRRLAVDHDHNTGKVRGLLCSHCNRALGLLKDKKELLQNAIHYLEKK